LEKISASETLNTLRIPSGELALLDVREEGVFACGHILLASSLPLSRLELEASRLVPRRSTRMIVCDDDDGLAQTAQSRLHALGYSNVVTLDGGMSAWVEAGCEVFAGLNTPGKALGVFAAKELTIPEIGADELAALLEKDADIKIVDCRPFSEYQRGSIPGAVNSPGIELLRQFAGGSAGAHLVVTCAGRTRGLLGAQTLIDAGVTGRITALHNGTMGWELSGRTLERKAAKNLKNTPDGATGPREIAEGIRVRAGISLVNRATLEDWRADEERTTYLFDIRERTEYEPGHLTEARQIAGGQLVQNFDRHVATLGARIVLSDDDGLRATGVALWLRRMGWSEIAVAPIENEKELERGEGRPVRAPLPKGARYIGPEDLGHRLKDKDTLLIDLANSRTYRGGHIPGAYFAIRSRLAKILPSLPTTNRLVLTSEDGRQAAFATGDALRFDGEILALSGGTAAWQMAGYPLSDSTDRFADRPEDVMLKPSELSEGRQEAMREYLSGSDDLLEKIERDATLRLNALPVT
jgi:rhodanese-related sulfurtransferase